MNSPKIIQADFFVTSGYQDQYMRSFKTNRNTDGLVDLFLRETNEGRNLTAGTMSRLAGDIMGIESKVTKDRDLIEIDNGWNTERLSFIIVVEMSNRNDVAKRIAITGYTDYDGISRISHEVDKSMMLIINNCFTVRSNPRMTRGGPGRQDHLVNNEYIIRGRKPRERKLFGNDNQHDTMLRPSDIYFNKAGADHINALGGADTYVDHRSKLVGDINLAKRIHNNAANYLADVISTGVESEGRMEATRGKRDLDRLGERVRDEDDDELSAAELAAARLSPEELHRNELFALFIQETEFEGAGEITWGELMRCCEEDRHCQLNVIQPGAVDRRGDSNHRHARRERDDSSSFHGADPTTMAAEITAKTLPALMMSSLISSANILLTNETINGQIQCVVTGEYPMISGMDVSYNASDLERILENDLGRILSRNNEIVFNLKAEINILADLDMQISIEGAQFEPFIVPIFTDGLLSPMKTGDHLLLDQISNDLDDLVSASVESRYEASGRADDKMKTRREGGKDLDSLFN